MNDKLLKEIVNQVFDLMDQYRKLLHAQFQDLNWGTRSVPDELFGKWFLMKSQENPNWLFALPYVDGGAAELGRFQRITTNAMRGMAA